MTNRSTPAEIRVRRYFTEGNPAACWEWQGGMRSSGYGNFNDRVDDRPVTVQAHRFVYEMLVGPIPEGLHLDHLCRNRACVNPSHLEPVTGAENHRRAIPFLPRGTTHHHGAKTHCAAGHPYDEENTYHYFGRHGGPCRDCRTCRAIHRAEHKARLADRGVAS